MLRKLSILVVVMLTLTVSAMATDDPHGSANSINCEQCHITHNTLGDILINSTDSLVSTLCISCHTPGGWTSMSLYISSSQKADPGVTGTSHTWDVPADNAERGASLPSSQTLLDHLTADDRVTCATCHDPHSNSTPPFLRMDNSANLLCLDCHSARNTTTVKSYTGSDLSHPVGIAIPASDTLYHVPPLDVDGNPQPSDGNTTNDYVLGTGDEVYCTSCHGVHYTDSDGSTVDGP